MTGFLTGHSGLKKYKSKNMASRLFKRYLIFMVLASAGISLMAQNTVPMGIHYQAVARDSYGNELINKKISVKFSIISGDPLAAPVYQELHDITTTKFGVFTLIIGRGTASLTPPCTTLSQVAWHQANHFLKVEVKFENDFMDMGTMQFLAVPYALYAQKSLEPGPEGPKGDKGEKGEPGDPATDNQTLSFDGSNLSISGAVSTVNLTPLLQTLQVSNDGTGGYNLSLTRGNTINLATIEKDGDTQNEIQDLSYNNTTRELSLLKSSAPAINLTELKNDADADPLNEIQDLQLNSDQLIITKNSGSAGVSLGKYLDDTDKQALKWDPAKRRLGIIGDTVTINLSELENDADADPVNEIQDLQLIDNKLSITGKTGAKEVNMSTYLDNTDIQTLDFTAASNTLAISGGNAVNLGVYRDNTDSQTLTYTEGTNELEISGGNKITIGSMVAFRAKKTSSETVTTWMTDYDFITNPPEYNDGGGFDYESGVFTAPISGIYTFSINYTATGSGDSRALKIYLNGSFFETLNSGISNGSIMTRQITMKLVAGNHVNLKVNVGTGYDTGFGTFSGFKVY
jgi:hypothetical protein